MVKRTATRRRDWTRPIKESCKVPLLRKQEGLRFEPDEGSPKHPYARVKIRGCGVLQIREEAPDPWREVVLEDFAVGSCRRWNCPAGETCDDLQKNGSMLFRLS